MLDPTHLYDPSNIGAIIASVMLVLDSVVGIPWVFSSIALGILFFRVFKGIYDACYHRWNR